MLTESNKLQFEDLTLEEQNLYDQHMEKYLDYSKEGKDDESLDEIFKALEIWPLSVRINTSLGHAISEIRGDYEKALGYFYTAIEIIDTYGNNSPSVNKLDLLYNIGLEYSALGDVEKGYEVARQMLEMVNEGARPIDIPFGNVLNNIANYFVYYADTLSRDPAEQTQIYEDSIKVLDRAISEFEAPIYYSQKASTLRRLNKEQEAYEALKKGYELYETEEGRDKSDEEDIEVLEYNREWFNELRELYEVDFSSAGQGANPEHAAELQKFDQQLKEIRGHFLAAISNKDRQDGALERAAAEKNNFVTELRQALFNEMQEAMQGSEGSSSGSSGSHEAEGLAIRAQLEGLSVADIVNLLKNQGAMAAEIQQLKYDRDITKAAIGRGVRDVKDLAEVARLKQQFQQDGNEPLQEFVVMMQNKLSVKTIGKLASSSGEVEAKDPRGFFQKLFGAAVSITPFFGQAISWVIMDGIKIGQDASQHLKAQQFASSITNITDFDSLVEAVAARYVDQHETEIRGAEFSSDNWFKRFGDKLKGQLADIKTGAQQKAGDMVSVFLAKMITHHEELAAMKTIDAKIDFMLSEMNQHSYDLAAAVEVKVPKMPAPKPNNAKAKASCAIMAVNELEISFEKILKEAYDLDPEFAKLMFEQAPNAELAGEMLEAYQFEQSLLGSDEDSLIAEWS